MSVIEKRIEIAAPCETVWRYLEDPDLLAGWLMRNDFRPNVGGSFSFFGSPGKDWDGILNCELVEFEPPRKISFTWNANDIGADTLVSIELTPKDEGTVLVLRHINWQDAKGDVANLIKTHGEGWDDHLGVLKTALSEDEELRPAPVIDWTKFQVWASIDAEPKKLFEAWATSGGLETFFVEAMQIRSAEGNLRAPDEIAQAGDSYVWRWNSGRIVQGQVLAVRAGKQIDYTFGDCKFRIKAHAYEGGTLLELEQYDMEDTPENRMHLHTNCRSAWVYFLTVLKTLLEHGVDGRDKTRKTGASFSTYFHPSVVGIVLPEE